MLSADPFEEINPLHYFIRKGDKTKEQIHGGESALIK